MKNLAEKVDGYLLNQGRYVLFVYNWERKKRPLYGVVGCCYSGVSNVLKSNTMEKWSGLSESSVGVHC